MGETHQDWDMTRECIEAEAVLEPAVAITGHAG